MWGVYEPVIVYAFKEHRKTGTQLCKSFLETLSLRIFYGHAQKGLASDAYYGVEVYLSKHGEVLIDDECKKNIDTIAKKYGYDQPGFYPVLDTNDGNPDTTYCPEKI